MKQTKFAAIACLAVSAPVLAQEVVSYTGDSFPDEVGWFRIEQPEKILADRSIEDGWFVLQAIVLPCPPLCHTQDHYRWNLTEQGGASAWYMEWVMQTDGPLVPGAVAPGSIVAAGISGIRYHFTIGNDELVFNRGSQFPLVFHAFEPGIHHFRLELQNDPPTGTYTFLFDGNVVDTGPAEGFYPIASSFVVFGAQAAIVDSETRWDWIEFGPFDPAVQPGDSDEDGEVDLADYDFFEQCHSISGPEIVPFGPTCLASCDMDNDGDVDLADFGGFQVALAGSN